MDQALADLIQPGSPKGGAPYRIVNESTGEIEIDRAGGSVRYTLKPLSELWGKDRGVTSINPADDRYMPLLLCIETEIMNHDDAAEDLTDGPVGLALDRMSLNPACDPGNDALCRRIQLGLRLNLSLNDYSKQEVKLAIRKIAKSVERHTTVAGIRGYLDFIRHQFRR